MKEQDLFSVRDRSKERRICPAVLNGSGESESTGPAGRFGGGGGPAGTGEPGRLLWLKRRK